jgi:hypothetical protein
MVRLLHAGVWVLLQCAAFLGIHAVVAWWFPLDRPDPALGIRVELGFYLFVLLTMVNVGGQVWMESRHARAAALALCVNLWWAFWVAALGHRPIHVAYLLVLGSALMVSPTLLAWRARRRARPARTLRGSPGSPSERSTESVAAVRVARV